jgi:hypothetical protein
MLLVTGAAGGSLLSFGAVAALLAYAAFGLAGSKAGGTGRSALDTVLLASALLVIGAVFLPALYYSIQRLRGRAVLHSNPAVLRVWQGILLLLVWIGAGIGAGFLYDKPIVKWVTPALYVLAIGIPVYFFVRLAAGGLHPGSRERWWGVLAAGIGLGITPAIITELILVGIGLVLLAVYIGLHPSQLTAFQQLADQLRRSNDPDQVMNTLGPWLRSPLALMLALLFFSGFSPMIEETAKSLATWTVFDRLASPAQGFAIGAISGAAFGLVESLLVSASPDSNWTTTLLVRGASTMMHIMAASLTGWGIGQFRNTHSFTRLLSMYLAAMSLHGLWNASVVAITFGSLRSAATIGGRDLAGTILMFMGAALLLLLCLAIPLGMGTINRRLRVTATAAPPTSPAVGADASLPPAPPNDVPWALEEDPRPAPDDTAPQPHQD